jgi:hypothetical protein
MTNMRPIRSIATALLVASLAVAGCGQSEPEETALPADQPPAVTAAPAPKAPTPPDGTTKSRPVVLADGRHPIFVSSVDPSRRTVSFDLIQFYWGDDATREAAKDHQESPPPNDYYIRNINPRLRTLPVRADATITVNSLGFGGQAEHPVSLARLGILTRSHDDWPPFWITVRDGQVVKIAEQWVP